MRLSTSQRMADRILVGATGIGLEEHLKNWIGIRYTGEEVARELEQLSEGAITISARSALRWLEDATVSI